MPEEIKKSESLGREAIIGYIIKGVQFLIREVPSAIPTLQALFAKKDPTDADFEAAKAKIVADSYSALVPNSQLGK